MEDISIDQDVYAYLQSKAIAYEENPNATLRRLFGLDNKSSSRKGHSRPHGKKPKTSLRALKTAGLLREGQRLHLRDYQGRSISEAIATINGEKLNFNNDIFSMSELAATILKENGYSSDSVRGPAFWFTDEGRCIKDLWQQYLKDERGIK